MSSDTLIDRLMELQRRADAQISAAQGIGDPPASVPGHEGPPTHSTKAPVFFCGTGLALLTGGISSEPIPDSHSRENDSPQGPEKLCGAQSDSAYEEILATSAPPGPILRNPMLEHLQACRTALMRLETGLLVSVGWTAQQSSEAAYRAAIVASMSPEYRRTVEGPDYVVPEGVFSRGVEIHSDPLVRMAGMVAGHTFEGVGSDARCACGRYRDDLRPRVREWIGTPGRAHVGELTAAEYEQIEEMFAEEDRIWSHVEGVSSGR